MKPGLTPLLRPWFTAMVRRRTRWADPVGAERTQRHVLAGLLRRGLRCTAGGLAAASAVADYEHFRELAPAVLYEYIRPDVMRMVHGERDVLWPGATRRFAQSSGTSGGKSKYIPIPAGSLRTNHYAGASEAVASYLALNPHSRIFDGRSMILGGSYATELTDLPAGTRVGDLSATLIDRVSPAVELVRIPSKDIALMSDWHRKLPALVAAAAAHPSVTNISGVPSWFLTVLRGVLEHTGASSIHEVWPGLEVFFHGGIAFGPYRSQYDAITDPTRMHYIENYNASEGFFAVQDTADPSAGMRLLLDAGVFYEFIPVDKYSEPTDAATMPVAAGEYAVPAWEVEPGRTYALVITACNGLCRYIMGDTVTVLSVEPLRIAIAGRTNAFINAFGEEVMVWNTDEALRRACATTGAAVADYTAAPVYTAGGTKGHHQWLIQWRRRPESVSDFVARLDAELQAVNSDYQAKRSGDIFLDPLEIVELPEGTFDRWLAVTGKLGGQRKVPRLANDRRVADQILNMIISNI